MSNHIIGASVMEQDLYDHVTSHADSERETLQAYEQLASTTTSKTFAYLARLILADERRHHQMLDDLATTIRTDAELSGDPGPIPLLDLREDRQEILAATERLLAIEQQDNKELKALAKELKDLKDTTAWALIIEIMQADNAKHLRILNFIKDHTRHPAY
jgi:rubrerythrin